MLSNIADEIQSYENPSPLCRDTLRRKINPILPKETIEESSEMIDTFKKRDKVKEKVMFYLQRNNIECIRTSVQRTIKELNLKPYKLRKAQKLTTAKKERVLCAKRLIRKFCARKTDSKW
ncbi:unnamed protein product [Rotaria sordida]|uniref:Uncharacterized protein n=1 Tax=Rotaria sordida TaxID=392033 RepID=A0A815LQ80_9BILA|nr:unnamed protein product [Rotaria sordida]CAF1538752.1 unnamed protein product [Rotaria sordida]CAF4217821.1 unnamed protein product [Rotaria sordida]